MSKENGECDRALYYCLRNDRFETDSYNVDGQIVLLHGFIKKSQKTPKQDLDLLNDIAR